MLFTHFGISGPLVLSASCYICDKFKEHDFYAYIDLKPALDKETLDKRILKDFNENINKNFNNSLDKLLPKKMIEPIIELCNIDPYKKVNEITKEEREILVENIKNIPLTLSLIHISKEIEEDASVLAEKTAEYAQLQGSVTKAASRGYVDNSEMCIRDSWRYYRNKR